MVENRTVGPHYVKVGFRFLSVNIGGLYDFYGGHNSVLRKVTSTVFVLSLPESILFPTPPTNRVY